MQLGAVRMCGRWGWKWHLKRNVIQFGINPKIIISFGYDTASLMHGIKIGAVCVTVFSYIYSVSFQNVFN